MNFLDSIFNKKVIPSENAEVESMPEMEIFRGKIKNIPVDYMIVEDEFGNPHTVLKKIYSDEPGIATRILSYGPIIKE